MRFLGLSAALCLSSCLQIGTSDNSSPDAAAGAAGTSSPAADAQVPSGGTGCAVDSVSGATLCTTIDQCPGLAVDHDLYPECGFRAPSTTIDLECVCGDFLCPVGAVLNCAQAQTLLADQSEIITCQQQNEGRCAPRTTSKPSKASCDSICAEACTGDINCRKLCGC
jgi:hypothetical protein